MTPSSVEVVSAFLGILYVTKTRTATMDRMKTSVQTVDVQGKHFNAMMVLVFQGPVFVMVGGNVPMVPTKQDVTRESLVMPSPSNAKADNVCHSTHFVTRSPTASTDLMNLNLNVNKVTIIRGDFNYLTFNISQLKRVQREHSNAGITDVDQPQYCAVVSMAVGTTVTRTAVMFAVSMVEAVLKRNNLKPSYRLWKTYTEIQIGLLITDQIIWSSQWRLQLWLLILFLNWIFNRLFIFLII